MQKKLLVKSASSSESNFTAKQSCSVNGSPYVGIHGLNSEGSVIRKNGHFGSEHDGSYESGFMTRCLLHNFSIIGSAIWSGHASSMPGMLDLLSVLTGQRVNLYYHKLH